jgi:nicotinamidase-related amidase
MGDPGATEKTPGFDFLLDEDGAHGISVSSWLDRNRVALVLNDFQNFCILEKYGFTNEYNRARYAETVLPNTRKLLKRFRSLGLPVVYTVLATRHERFLDLPGVCRKVLARDLKMTDRSPYFLRVEDEDSRVPDEIAPRPEDIVVVKSSSGAFNSSDIDSILRNNGIGCLVFTGGISELCLSSTVRGAYDRGYLCTVAEDATITGSAEKQYWAMEFLRGNYAWVTSTEEVLNRFS